MSAKLIKFKWFRGMSGKDVIFAEDAPQNINFKL